MKQIAIGKAVSKDKIMDMIFNKAEYLQVVIDGQRFDLEDEYNKEEAANWKETIQYKLA